MSDVPSPSVFFKICERGAWESALRAGRYEGSPHDVRDGFIHFSFAHQLATTAAKHFAGQTDLVIVTVDPTRLGGDLRYEPARDGDRFPHLYGPLPTSAAIDVSPLPWDGTTHVFPPSVHVRS